LTPITQLKAVLVAGMLVALWALETIAPMVRGRRGRWRHGLRNLALGAANTVLAWVAVRYVLAGVAAEAEARRFGLLHWADWPRWLAWPAAIVLFDAWMYAWHRLNHVVGLLWRFHAVHHTDADLDVTSAVRFHTGEIVLSLAARAVVLCVLGMTVGQMVLYEAILLPVTLLHHSNVRIGGGLDRALRTVLVSPHVHWGHHSRRAGEWNANYGGVFSWWDRLGRTLRLTARPGEIEMGLPGYPPARWDRLPAMLAQPFRRPPVT